MTRTRKPKNPFAHQHHRGPDISMPPLERFERSFIVGEYVMNISPTGVEQCFLKTPLGIPVIGVTVFTHRGREFDICHTWLKGEAHQAMLRLPASSGWRIKEFETHHAKWERPAPVTRNFVG